MIRLSSTVCPFCEASALSKLFSPKWQSSRSAATLQKRKPSRMTLSPHVKRGTVETTSRGRPAHKSRNSPWAGTNMTTVPASLVVVQPTADRRRTSGRSAGRDRGKDTKTSDGMKALKMQRALANVSYEKRNRVKELLQERDRFEQFDLLPVIQESVSSQVLDGLVDVSPTPIQRLAIPALLGSQEGKKRRFRSIEAGMQSFLLAAETGSGKTLAYTLPIIDALKRAEMAEAAHEARQMARETEQKQRTARSRMFEIEAPPRDEPDASTARPKSIILVPTSELVEQVGRLIKSLSHTVKFRAALLSSSYTGKMIRSRLFTTSGIDIVVCTPHLLSSITEADPNILSRVTHLVVDEADSLLDRSFAPTTSEILDRVRPSLKQLILCSATIPKSLDAYLSKRFPDLRRLATPNLHAIPRRVQLSVIDIDKVPYQGNRDLACAQVIYDIGKEAANLDEREDRERKILVFVNEREKTTELADYLRKKGIDAVALMRDSESRTANETLAAFTSTSTSTSTSSPHQPAPLPIPTQREATRHRRQARQGDAEEPRQSLPNTKVLICTDIASRGIDTIAIKHVILYDVPHTSIDFIHRLGRLGRMGRRGRGVVLVGGKDRRDVVREVREGMFRGAALI